jgi:hypothetical protein
MRPIESCSTVVCRIRKALARDISSSGPAQGPINLSHVRGFRYFSECLPTSAAEGAGTRYYAICLRGRRQLSALGGCVE